MSPPTHGRLSLAKPVARSALLVVLSILGCGQKPPASAADAKAVATDTTTQAEPAAADSSILQPELGQATSATSSSEPTEPASKPAKQQTGTAALAKAAAAGRYALVLFYRADDDETREMRKTLTGAASRPVTKASLFAVDVTDAKEREIVTKFGVDRAPMPLALVVAPTGAVTGGFPGSVTEEQLSGAFVGPATARCLKALQDGKFVLLCAQNNSTRSNDAALKGVQAFKEDARYAGVTEIVSVDPTDPAESKFLGQVKIDSKTSVAMTAFLAPPGAVIATYSGATDKNTIVAALTRATSGSGGG